MCDITIDNNDLNGMPIRIDWADEPDCHTWFSAEDAKDFRNRLKLAIKLVKVKRSVVK